MEQLSCQQRVSAYAPSSAVAEKLRARLVELKKAHPDNSAGVTTCFQTMQRYLANIYKDPSQDKFRSIKLSNAAFQQRVGAFTGSIEALELCGFKVTLPSQPRPPRCLLQMRSCPQSSQQQMSDVAQPDYCAVVHLCDSAYVTAWMLGSLNRLFTCDAVHVIHSMLKKCFVTSSLVLVAEKRRWSNSFDVSAGCTARNSHHSWQ